LGQLKGLGAVWTNVQIKQSFISLYSNSVPNKVDPTNPNTFSKLVDFYSTLEAKISNVGPIEFIKELVEIVLDGDFYVRMNTDYYLVDLKFPYFGIHYVTWPLP